MRIYLQSQPTPSGFIRFVHLVLQEDLMGGWTLIRESGNQGSPGTVKRENFDAKEQALEAMVKWRDKNIKRGFRVAFVEGDRTPANRY